MTMDIVVWLQVATVIIDLETAWSEIALMMRGTLRRPTLVSSASRDRTSSSGHNLTALTEALAQPIVERRSACPAPARRDPCTAGQGFLARQIGSGIRRRRLRRGAGPLALHLVCRLISTRVEPL